MLKPLPRGGQRRETPSPGQARPEPIGSRDASPQSSGCGRVTTGALGSVGAGRAIVGAGAGGTTTSGAVSMTGGGGVVSTCGGGADGVEGAGAGVEVLGVGAVGREAVAAGRG